VASIGVRINHSTAGTDIASTLAKALLPNVGNAIDVANLNSKLMTDEMERQRLRELTTFATQQAIGQAKENQYKQAEFNAQTGMADTISKILQDQQGQRNAAAATEPPVVVPDTVLQGGGNRVPEMLRSFDDERLLPPATPPPAVAPDVVSAVQQPSYGQEPDWQYRVNQFPIRADEPPVPIELPPLPGQAQLAGVPADLQTQPPLRLPLPPQLRDVPPDLIDEPLVGQGGPVGTGGIVGTGGAVGAGEPLIGGASVIDRMLAGMNKRELPPGYFTPPASLELPVPVEQPLPPDYLTPPTELNRPVVPADMPGAAALAGVPPELQPIPVGEPEVIALPGRGPVSPETVAATTPAPATLATEATAAAPRELVTGPGAGTITTKAPGSVGTGVVNADGSSVYQTEEGPVPLTAEETHKLALGIAYGNDPAGQLSKLAGVIKTTYDPGITLTPNQKAELLSGVSPIGTPEETASKIAIAKATGDIKTTMIADRAYTLSRTPNGRTVATLVEGQPPPKAASRFGDSAEGFMRTGVSDLMVNKPDPKTWTPTERQDFSIMVDALYGAKVHVTDNGKIVVTSGKLPEGVLPGSAGFDARNPPPPTATETPPAETQAAPATTTPAPATTTPTPITTTPAPTAPAAPATQPPAETAGETPSEMINGIKVKNYGGWLRTGEKPKETVSEIDGQKITQVESTGPSEMDNNVRKELNYTKNVVHPGKFMLDMTADKVPNVAGQVIQAVASNNSLLQTLGSMALSPQEREYFQNVQAFINAVTHKSSGADVTAADLRTYGYLFSLPPKERVAASDLRVFKNRVIDDIRNSRTGWTGAVPSDQLRLFDTELAKAGIDLDKVYTDADSGMTYDYEEK
jgi:hypothetical protein